MSKQAAAGAPGVQRKIYSAYDEPGTGEEISRRQFMANATLAVGGIVGLGLAIPIIGSLVVPKSGGGSGNWAPLNPDEVKQLDDATKTPIKLTFALKSKDSYLPEQSTEEYVWGIKVNDPGKFKTDRADLFKADGASTLPYDSINMSFVIFSPICPHLGCRPVWNGDASRFQCPCHGSQFSFEGEHLAGPAPRGMDPLPFKEQSGTADVMWIRYKSGVPDRIVISYQS